MTRPPQRMFDFPLVDGMWEPVDGDTVDVERHTTRYDKQWVRLRLLDIDTPDDVEAGPGVSYGVKEATWFTTLWGYGRTLRATMRAEDSFGRPLADVYDVRTGEHLDAALIRYCRDVLGLDITYRR